MAKSCGATQPGADRFAYPFLLPFPAMILRRQALVAWIAVLAVMLQAPWPLIAQARPGGEKVAVCTIDGITHNIELPGVPTPLDKSSQHQGDHCKLCVFGSGKAVLAPSKAAVFCGADTASPKAGSADASWPQSRFDTCARPRAPPQYS